MYVYAPALEAAATTVLTVWLRVCFLLLSCSMSHARDGDTKIILGMIGWNPMGRCSTQYSAVLVTETIVGVSGKYKIPWTDERQSTVVFRYDKSECGLSCRAWYEGCATGCPPPLLNVPFHYKYHQCQMNAICSWKNVLKQTNNNEESG
jgi:hypothetical protein